MGSIKVHKVQRAEEMCDLSVFNVFWVERNMATGCSQECFNFPLYAWQIVTVSDNFAREINKACDEINMDVEGMRVDLGRHICLAQLGDKGNCQYFLP